MIEDPSNEQTRIVVVEDEGLIALDLKNKLTEMGFIVCDLARTGLEAIEKVGIHSPDLVLMDIRLEGDMDGVAAAEQIRNRFGTPVIFLTAYADNETLARAKVTAPYGYLIKPATERELRIVTSIAIHRNRAQELLQTRARQQAAVAAFAQRALKGASLDSLLEDGVQVVANGSQVEFCKVLVLQPDQETLFLKAGVGWRDNLVGKAMLPRGSSVGRLTLQVQHPVIVEDLTKNSALTTPNFLSDHGIVSGLSVIIPGIDTPYGILGAYTKRKRNFTEDDVHFVQSIANVISLAMERQHAEQSAIQQQKKQEAEKRRREELEEFTYFASHDLREPLRQITSYSQLLKMNFDKQMDTKGAQFLQFIVDGSNRMQRLIDGLIAYSKLSAKEETPSDVDCNSALADAIANLEVTLKESGGTISRGKLPSVFGKKALLVQLFQNLIANSLKYRDAGKPPKIEVKAAKTDGEWIFSVRDNGIGFDKQYAEQIFLMFRRLHGPHEYPGSGIGLALCKRIVQTHGGRIWVESKPGDGSVFSFTLPGAKVCEEHQYPDSVLPPLEARA